MTAVNAAVRTGLPSARLEQLRTGGVDLLGSTGIRSAIEKSIRPGRVRIGPLGFEGDAQQESFHGGHDRAVLQYDRKAYAAWIREFPTSADLFVPGGFGENFSAAGLDERTLCIGDVVSVGTAVLQVAESRQPCFKLNHRFRQPAMARRVQESGRTGWLYRVLEPGTVAIGDTISVTERPLPRWSIARVQHFLYAAIDDIETAGLLADLPYLSAAQRSIFARRVENAGEIEDWGSRLSNGGLASGRSTWFEAEIAEATRETADVRSLRLVRSDGGVLPLFEAGAHIGVKIDNSLTRSYSLYRLPDATGFHIAVHRSPTSRGGSAYLNDEAEVGRRLMITEPQNFFPLAADGDEHLLIAGGIGITPILAMIEQLESDGKGWELRYLARSREQAPFHDVLSARHPGRVHLHLTGGDPDQRLDLERLLSAHRDRHLYACGSAGLMAAVRNAASQWPDGRVHFESFGGESADNAGDVAFTAEIRSTGAEFEVAPGSTLLERLRESGIAVDSSCETGTCGTCRIGFLAGEVRHGDLVLGRTERTTTMTPCVSRAVGRIVLDL